MRKSRYESVRISFRLPKDEKLAAENLARRHDLRLSEYVRQALREKAQNDARG